MGTLTLTLLSPGPLATSTRVVSGRRQTEVVLQNQRGSYHTFFSLDMKVMTSFWWPSMNSVTLWAWSTQTIPLQSWLLSTNGSTRKPSSSQTMTAEASRPSTVRCILFSIAVWFQPVCRHSATVVGLGGPRRLGGRGSLRQLHRGVKLYMTTWQYNMDCITGEIVLRVQQ